jgi:hypothetical protein
MSAIGADPSSRTGTGAVTLGLRANWRQFAPLVLINAFVGGMVGIERTVVPLIGSEEFHIASHSRGHLHRQLWSDQGLRQSVFGASGRRLGPQARADSGVAGRCASRDERVRLDAVPFRFTQTRDARALYGKRVAGDRTINTTSSCMNG